MPEKDPRGRKPRYEAPKEEIASAIGTSERELIRAEQHIAIAEAIPELQGPEWKQSYVLAFKENLEKLPEKDREAAKALASEEFERWYDRDPAIGASCRSPALRYAGGFA